jgi:hypothetical protein
VGGNGESLRDTNGTPTIPSLYTVGDEIVLRASQVPSARSSLFQKVFLPELQSAHEDCTRPVSPSVRFLWNPGLVGRRQRPPKNS